MRNCLILSIDGGGIRGIIPSLILSELKDRLEERGINKPFHEIFNLMAGTSTGGLIALALSAPLYKKTDGDLYDESGGVVPQKLPGLYETMGERVFPGNPYSVWRFGKQLFRSKYSAVPLQQVCQSIFKDCTTQKALTNLLVTSFDMKSMTPVFIKRRPAYAGGNEDPDFYMGDAALATSAVPTYFPPAYVESVKPFSQDFCLVDGGIFCINPALSALIEARKIFPYSKYMILSLGTGIQIEKYKTETIKNWGFFNWIAPWLKVPLIAAVGDGQRMSTNHMLKKLPNAELFRMDIVLDRGWGAMDDGSRKNLQYLLNKAKEMIEQYTDVLDRFAKAAAEQHQ